MAYKNKQIANSVTGQSIKFLQTARDTGGHLLEMESSYRPHSTEPPPHYHPEQEEDFLVLSGELTVRMNGQLRVLSAGEQLHIPKNTVHSMWNASAQTTTMNWKVVPAIDTEYFLETAAGLAADGMLNKKGMPPFLQTVMLADRYRSIFRMAKPPYLIQRILFALLKPLAYICGYRAVYRKYLD